MNNNYRDMSMVEVAIELQAGAKQLTFIDLFNKVAEKLELNDEEKRERIAQFYTDVTSSGDFIYCGDDMWDLKKNQKLEALDSEFYNEHFSDLEDDEEYEKPKTRKTRKKSTKSVEVQDEEGNTQVVSEDESYDGEDQAYEAIEDEYESTEFSDTDAYEKDFDSSIDEDEEEGDEDYDSEEDEYNDIMDDYEDLYDN